jgi:hypothetical protein
MTCEICKSILNSNSKFEFRKKGIQNKMENRERVLTIMGRPPHFWPATPFSSRGPSCLRAPAHGGGGVCGLLPGGPWPPDTMGISFSQPVAALRALVVSSLSSTNLPSMAGCAVVARSIDAPWPRSRRYREPRPRVHPFLHFSYPRDHHCSREGLQSEAERERERAISRRRRSFVPRTASKSRRIARER